MEEGNPEGLKLLRDSLKKVQVEAVDCTLHMYFYDYYYFYYYYNYHYYHGYVTIIIDIIIITIFVIIIIIIIIIEFLTIIISRYLLGSLRRSRTCSWCSGPAETWPRRRSTRPSGLSSGTSFFQR